MNGLLEKTIEKSKDNKERDTEVDMRKLIAGMKVSVDGRMEGPEQVADWVEAWSEDYGLTRQIDACLLGGGMYPGYEQYWTGIQNEPSSTYCWGEASELAQTLGT